MATIEEQPPHALAQEPGALRSQLWLTIQTREAKRLVTGRRAESGRAGIIGLTRFAALLRPLWNAARADDPYADWWLLQVDEALEQAHGTVQTLSEPLATLWQGLPAVDIQVAESLEPLRVPLQFGNPYAFRGAYLVADYDSLVRRVLTAQHVGLLPREDAERRLALGGRAVRRTYSSPVGYKFFGITREDVVQGTARALEACAAMGELPAEVRDRARRGRYAPEIRATVSRTAPES
jgi:integrating conjugative element protein (TIGR03761 family)